MMSLLIKPPNTSLELIGNNHDVKSHFAYIYFTGFNGILEKKLVDYYHPGSLTIIRNRAGGVFLNKMVGIVSTQVSLFLVEVLI
ncbi:hypothetical protein ABF220_001323 [Yersinia ruckeri]